MTLALLDRRRLPHVRCLGVSALFFSSLFCFTALPASQLETKKQEGAPAGVASQALSAQELFKRCASAVFVVEALDEAGRVLALGSGVAIGADRLVTNEHVIEGPAASFRVKQNAKVWAAEAFDVDPENDLCVLQVNGLPASDLRLRRSETLVIGERVYAIGAPEGLELSISDGLLSGIRSIGIQTTAAISPGSSGGGLFDAQGRLIGITRFYIRDGQNLNFAVPIELVDVLYNRTPIEQSVLSAPPPAGGVNPTGSIDAMADAVKTIVQRMASMAPVFAPFGNRISTVLDLGMSEVKDVLHNGTPIEQSVLSAPPPAGGVNPTGSIDAMADAVKTIVQRMASMAPVFAPFGTRISRVLDLGMSEVNNRTPIERSARWALFGERLQLLADQKRSALGERVMKEVNNWIFQGRSALGIEVPDITPQTRPLDKNAAKAFNRALELNPLDGATWAKLGLAYAHLGLADDSFLAFDKATRLMPQDKRIWENYASGCSILKKENRRVEIYREAVKHNPKNLFLLLDLGNAYWSAKMRKEAKQVYQRAREIASTANDWDMMGNTFLFKIPIEAIRCFERALQMTDKADFWYPKRLCDLGQAYAIKGNRSKVKEISNQLRGRDAGCASRLLTMIRR